MLALSAALLRRQVPGLSQDPPRPEGIRSWIDGGGFYLGADHVGADVLLQNISMTEIVPYLAYDYERFALASLESLLAAVPDKTTPKAIAWPLSKLYYSAFFGAHALLRAIGHSIVRFEPAQAVRLTQIASLYSSDVAFTSGTYHSWLIQHADLTIDAGLQRLPESGGAHDQFWRMFHLLLGRLGQEVSAKNEPDAISIVAEISDIRDTLSANGFSGGTWLSAVRNQITYQHKHGVWFPFQHSPSNVVEYMKQLMVRDSASIRRDYNPSRDPVLAFSSCCQLIAMMNCDVAIAVGRSMSAHRFRQLWTRLHRPQHTT